MLLKPSGCIIDAATMCGDRQRVCEQDHYRQVCRLSHCLDGVDLQNRVASEMATIVALSVFLPLLNHFRLASYPEVTPFLRRIRRSVENRSQASHRGLCLFWRGCDKIKPKKSNLPLTHDHTLQSLLDVSEAPGASHYYESLGSSVSCAAGAPLHLQIDVAVDQTPQRAGPTLLNNRGHLLP